MGLTFRVCTGMKIYGKTYEHPMHTLFGSLVSII
jgi:hypothetical protein